MVVVVTNGGVTTVGTVMTVVVDFNVVGSSTVVDVVVVASVVGGAVTRAVFRDAAAELVSTASAEAVVEVTETSAFNENSELLRATERRSPSDSTLEVVVDSDGPERSTSGSLSADC